MTDHDATAPVTADPVVTEIIANSMVATAHEMNNIVVRTAFNPLLYDTKDFAVAVLSPDGELWAEDPGLAVFIGCMPATVPSGLAKLGADGYGDGDVLIVNDPYLTGTHISDTTVYAPVLHEGRLVAFVAVTAHWADVGGRTPGGWDMTSTELFQEGLCFTHQRLVRGHEPVADMLDLIASNVRFPDIVRGDLDAQMSACRAGATRIVALCERYGAAVVRGAMDRTVDATARAVARRVEALPDGTVTRSVEMDYDGVDPDVRPRVSVSVTVRGDRMHVGFDGTSGVAQSSMNITAAGTGSYQLFGVYLLRTDPTHGDPFIMIDPIDGGHGGHSSGHGETLVFSLDGDTLNLPVEVMENRYPLRCLRYSFAEGSEGAGEHAGGRGIVRDYQVLEDGTVLKYANENTRDVLSRGSGGGGDGEASHVVLRPGTDTEETLWRRGNDAGELRPGDVVRAVSGGGGGWGPPPA
ncbi:hydantoinase B/oxoprolinase family protein [Pseudonocardia sp. ICBG601]|uniref:hydantoinase B/oxoprolinase family protein n=1 Tax=Pseudonocardia sp. ICBG601 TaxID=2846759 RepID=UPI001CF662A5|nr:hydantoinase B/oxoprolinase family protein [Pseudonocardia sp. ICBG601]